MKHRTRRGPLPLEQVDVTVSLQHATTNTALTTPFDQTDLLALAGPTVYSRGQAYFEQGQVLAPLLTNQHANARVLGERPYRVTLTGGEHGLQAECDCPLGQRGDFCKHAVALGLAWLQRHIVTPPQSANRLLEFVIHTLSLSPATESNEDWLQQVQLALKQLLEGGKLRTAINLIEQALLMQTEARRLPAVNLGALDRLEYLLCQFHQLVCQRGALSLEACARRLLKLELHLVGEGLVPTSVGQKLASLYEAALGAGWVAAYQQQQHARAAELALIKDAKLTLVQRRQRAWLTPDLQLVNVQTEASILATEDSKEAAGNSDLVVQHWLAAGNSEAAWQAAQAGGCADALWLKLASLRARRHPAEALLVYQRLIRRAFERKDGFSAQQAFKLLPVVRRLFQRLHRVEEFEEYQAELIEQFGRQRTFRHWHRHT